MVFLIVCMIMPLVHQQSATFKIVFRPGTNCIRQISEKFKNYNMNQDIGSDFVMLSDDESRKISGGIGFPLALGIALLVSAINDFGDIREGLMDGFNGTPRH